MKRGGDSHEGSLLRKTEDSDSNENPEAGEMKSSHWLIIGAVVLGYILWSQRLKNIDPAGGTIVP